MDGEDATSVRAHRLRGRLLLHRPVVPEAGRPRKHAAGTRTSFTRRPSSIPTTAIYDVRMTVPAGFVLGASGREMERTANAGRHRDASLRRRGHPRLRVDDEPRLHRLGADVRASLAAAGADAAAAAARARRPGVAPLRRHRRRSQVLRRVLRTLSVRPHHDRRPGVPERRGRHGVPDALHRGRPLARAAARGGARARDDPRGRPPVVVRHGRQQRIRTRVDGRGAQHLFRSADDGGGGVPELPRPAVLRRVRAVGDRRHPDGRAPPT